jgi:CRISPR-associated protein Cas2
MTDRALYVIAYDISEPRRLRRALITVRAYASGGQKSVHECYLSPSECLQLSRKLHRILHAGTDSLVIIRLDPRARPRCLGIARPPSNARVLYVG